MTKELGPGAAAGEAVGVGPRPRRWASSFEAWLEEAGREGEEAGCLLKGPRGWLCGGGGVRMSGHNVQVVVEAGSVVEMLVWVWLCVLWSSLRVHGRTHVPNTFVGDESQPPPAGPTIPTMQNATQQPTHAPWATWKGLRGCQGEYVGKRRGRAGRSATHVAQVEKEGTLLAHVAHGFFLDPPRCSPFPSAHLYGGLYNMVTIHFTGSARQQGLLHTSDMPFHALWAPHAVTGICPPDPRRDACTRCTRLTACPTSTRAPHVHFLQQGVVLELPSPHLPHPPPPAPKKETRLPPRFLQQPRGGKHGGEKAQRSQDQKEQGHR